MDLRFTPAMHLKSEKQISALFKTGKSVSSFPVRVRYLEIQEPNNKAAFTVSKRLFKLAVDRNRIKRLLREAYRTQKHLLDQKGENGTNFALLFMYVDKSPTTQEQVTTAMVNVLKQVL